MRCEELMKRQVECLRPGDTAQHAAVKMRNENIGFLPVCDEAGKVLGTLTDRDIAIRLVAQGKSATSAVSDIMTREVVACKPSDDIRHAERLLAEQKKSRIMCVDDAGRLVGVIGLSDIAQEEEGGQVAATLREVTQREAA
jgi:CBS-domain-containing membrane protein